MKTTRSVIARAAVTSVLASAAILLTGGQANAATDYWGAIAISPQTGNVGYSYDHPNDSAAARAAVNSCNASDCQAVVRVANGCAAVAQAPNLAWGWGYGASRRAAEQQAIAGTPGSGARIVTWVCTTGHL
jgi:hypothetical protein